MNTRFSFLASLSAQSFLYGTQLLPSPHSEARAYYWPHTYMHDGLLLATNIVMKYIVELGDKYGKELTPARRYFSDCTCAPCFSLQRVPLHTRQFCPVQTVFSCWVWSHQPSTWSISAAFTCGNLSAGLLKWSCESWYMVDSCYGKLCDGSFSLARLIFLDSRWLWALSCSGKWLPWISSKCTSCVWLELYAVLWTLCCLGWNSKGTASHKATLCPLGCGAYSFDIYSMTMSLQQLVGLHACSTEGMAAFWALFRVSL